MLIIEGIAQVRKNWLPGLALTLSISSWTVWPCWRRGSIGTRPPAPLVASHQVWPSTVIFKHALKNALIPTVTVMGLQIGFLIGGAIVVETLFAMPGLGTFGIDAIIARDYQQVQGFALLTALAFVVMNLAVDLTYTFLDPRIRYA